MKRPSTPALPTLQPGERRWVALLVALGCVGLAFAGTVALHRISTAMPERGGSYREGLVGRIRSLNPLTCRELPAEADACALVFAGLTRADPETNTTVGDLAQSWTVTPSHRTYTFTLRPDARFHDGDPVTAEDVVFTYQVLGQDPALVGPVKETFKGVTITAVDARTISFVLQKENAFFPETLSLGILPKHEVNGVGAAALASHPFTQRPVGAGPFRVVELAHDDGSDTLTLEPVDPTASIQRLTLVAYHDAAALNRNLADVDGVKEVLPPFDPQTAPGWRQVDLRLPRYVGVFFNTEHKVVGGPKVRQALSLAIPRKSIIDSTPGAQPVWAALPALEQRGASPLTDEQARRRSKRAEELLVEAGWRISAGATGTYRVKDGQQLVVHLATSGDADYVAAANKIRDAWRDLGVTVTLVTPPTITDLETGIIQPGNYDALLVGISTDIDLDLYPQFHSSQVGGGANFSRYRDIDADELMQQIRRTPDAAEQLRLAGNLVDLLQRDAPAAFLFSPPQAYALRTSVDGVVIPPRLATISDRFALFSHWTVNHSYAWE